MDDCIDSLVNAKIFSTLDENSSYWQVPILNQDRNKTAFTSHAGIFRYKRIPFGLTNATGSFQRALDLLLSKFKWNTCLVFLDDVIIYLNTFEDHICHCDEIIQGLGDDGVTHKLKMFLLYIYRGISGTHHPAWSLGNRFLEQMCVAKRRPTNDQERDALVLGDL